MAKSFDTYMAESGQQGTLDALRKPGGGYDAALSEYTSSGSYGSAEASDSIDTSQIPSVQDFVNNINTTEEDALSNIVATIGGLDKPLDIYSQLEEEAGIPELRDTAKTLSQEIFNIEDTLESIEPNIDKRIKDSLITEAQRSRMVSSERLPFLKNLSKIATSLGRIESGIQSEMQGIIQKTQLAIAGDDRMIDALKLQYQGLVDRNSRLLTGFTLDRQTQLDVLWDKLDRTRALDDREWELANLLARDEDTYIKELRSTAAGLGVTNLTGDAVSLLSGISNTIQEQIQYERSRASADSDGGGGVGWLNDIMDERYGDNTSSSSRYTFLGPVQTG